MLSREMGRLDVGWKA